MSQCMPMLSETKGLCMPVQNYSHFVNAYVPDPLKTGEALAVIGSIVRRVAAQQSE